MSPGRSPRSWLHQRRAFTLVELLVVVLIIGILAAIALPRLLGQRTRAKNAAAQAAARHALVAARSYYTQNSESYVGLGPTQLQGYESSLGTTEPGDGQTPGSSANPQNIWIGNGLDGTNPNTVAGGDSNGGSTVTLCSVSRGDTVYCVKDVSGVATYLQAQSSSGTVASAAASSYSAGGWSAATSTTPSSLSVDYLVVAGGGGGGAGRKGGGGGGGGVLSGSGSLSAGSYAVVIGSGGNGGSGSGSDGRGSSGNSSSIGGTLNVTAAGGGGGGGVNSSSILTADNAPLGNSYGDGRTGGSGGGGIAFYGVHYGATGSVGQDPEAAMAPILAVPTAPGAAEAPARSEGTAAAPMEARAAMAQPAASPAAA